MIERKTALITGASGGIGLGIAKAYAHSGVNVIMLSRRPAPDEDMAEMAAQGVKIKFYQCDVADFGRVQEVFTQAAEDFGRIDIVVNNAGITKDGLLMRMSEESFDSVINVNLKGTFNVCRAAVPAMVRARGGRIINISSVSGLYGNAGQVNYSASKAGIIGLTKSLSKEVGSRGITVNAIAPGFIDTAMTAGLDDKVKDRLMDNLSIKRLGTAEDIAALALFLASDAASYITGQVIAVDGGLRL